MDFLKLSVFFYSSYSLELISDGMNVGACVCVCVCVCVACKSIGSCRIEFFLLELSSWFPKNVSNYSVQVIKTYKCLKK